MGKEGGVKTYEYSWFYLSDGLKGDGVKDFQMDIREMLVYFFYCKES